MTSFLWSYGKRFPSLSSIGASTPPGTKILFLAAKLWVQVSLCRPHIFLLSFSLFLFSSLFLLFLVKPLLEQCSGRTFLHGVIQLIDFQCMEHKHMFLLAKNTKKEHVLKMLLVLFRKEKYNSLCKWYLSQNPLELQSITLNCTH